MDDGLRCHLCERLLPRSRWNAMTCQQCDTETIYDAEYGTPANIGGNR